MNFSADYRNGGPNSDRATDSQIKRLIELGLKFEKTITWLEAKKLIKEYHQTKAKK